MTASHDPPVSQAKDVEAVVNKGKSPLHKSSLHHRDVIMIPKNPSASPSSSPSSIRRILVAKKDMSTLQKSLEKLAANKEKAEKALQEQEQLEQEKEDHPQEETPPASPPTRKTSNASDHSCTSGVSCPCEMEDVCDVVYDANKSMHALEEEAFEQGLLLGTFDEMEIDRGTATTTAEGATAYIEAYE